MKGKLKETLTEDLHIFIFILFSHFVILSVDTNYLAGVVTTECYWKDLCVYIYISKIQKHIDYQHTCVICWKPNTNILILQEDCAMER